MFVQAWPTCHGDFDSTLPTNIELPSRLSDVDVDESSSWWSLSYGASKVRQTISTVAFELASSTTIETVDLRALASSNTVNREKGK